MLQTDYIMRLIHEFFKALDRYLNNDEDRRGDEIVQLYNEFLGPADFFRTAPMDDVMDSFRQYPESERLQRMEMLAELYYADADTATGVLGDELMRRSLALFGFIDRHDRTLNFGRKAKMAALSQRLAGSDRN